jgi:hypothetical protein
VNGLRLAQGSFCAFALLLSSCFWLAQYADLSSAFGDAGTAADAQPASDAGPPFCPPDAGPLAYCMDFDGVDPATLHLDVNQANAGIVESTYVSFPSSLLVTLQGAASSGKYDVSFPLKPTTTRLEFQIQTVGLDEGVTTLAIALLEPATQTARKLNVVVAPNESFQVQEYVAFADGGAQTSAHAWFQVDASAPTAWHHVVLTLKANDATKEYTSGLTVDGKILEDGHALQLPWAGGTVTLDVGVTYAASGNQGFFFDNVRADFTL